MSKWIPIIAGFAGGMLTPILFGVYFVIIGGRDINYSRECFIWPATNGVIIESGVYERKDEDNSTWYYSPYIKYSYIVNGKTYINDRKSYQSEEDGNRKVIENQLTDFKKGNSVKVFYKPDKPEFSVLERREPLSNFAKYFGWFLIFFGLALGIFLFKICRAEFKEE